MVSAAIIAFFKALPELVGVLRDIGESVQQLRKEKIDRDLSELKEQANELIAETLRGGLTIEDRKRIVAKLNSLGRK